MITIPQISTNQIITSQLIEHKKKTMKYDVRNPGPSLRQTQKCGCVKPVDEIQSNCL